MKLFDKALEAITSKLEQVGNNISTEITDMVDDIRNSKRKSSTSTVDLHVPPKVMPQTPPLRNSTPPPKNNTPPPLAITNSPQRLPMPSIAADHDITLPDWYVSVSFGKSTSSSYDKAVALAKAAPQYHEQVDDGKILHQAIYSAKPKEYLAFIMLYELVGGWKSSFVMINGQLIDRKIIGNLNYCYGDNCRSGNPKFCFGASYMTENPFGCHRLQISACNNPWWSFYNRSGNKWFLDKIALKQRIDSFAGIYCLCPKFNYDYIITILDKLPQVITDAQMRQLQQQNSISITLNL